MSDDVGSGDEYGDDADEDVAEVEDGEDREAEDDTERANLLLRASCDCRARLVTELSLLISDKDRRFEAAPCGVVVFEDCVDAVATERTWHADDRARALATADDEEDDGSRIAFVGIYAA